MNRRVQRYGAVQPRAIAIAQGQALPGAANPWNLLFAQSGEPETVTVQRRRKTDQSGPRERAETQHRETGGGGGAPPPPSGGGGSSGGGGGSRSGGRGPNIPGGGCGAIVVFGVLVLLAIFGFLRPGGETTGDSSVLQQSQQQGGFESSDQTSQSDQGVQSGSVFESSQGGATTQQAAPTVAPTTAPAAGNTAGSSASSDSAATAGQKWTVMMYQDADDKVLEQDIFVDFNEAERIGSTDRVNIVAQLDRYKGGFSGDGDWHSTRRYYITKDNDLDRIGSKVIAEGESSMGEGETLVDFVDWAVKNYPADKYVLILSDHGMGWPGGWTDPNPATRTTESAPLAGALGNALYLNELDDALAKIQQQVGIDKFEIIGMDACLMAQLEVFTALQPYANYAVASQETEPAVGWAYTAFLNNLVNNPDISGADLSKSIVDTYIQDDQRIQDPQARAAMYSRGGYLGMGGVPSAQQVIQQMGQDVTLTAVDLNAVPNLNQAVDNLAVALQQVDQRAIAKARSYAQAYTSIFGSDVPPSYLDLGNFVGLLQQVDKSAQTQQAGNAVLAAIQQAVIAEKHGPGKRGSTGVAIYFPNSQLYGTREAGPQSYLPIAARFADTSLWPSFLKYFYTGQTFEPEQRRSGMPAAGAAMRAPGSGGITVSPVEASADVAAPGRPITLSTVIEGENVGHVYLFTGQLDPQTNSLWVADLDYLESPTTREVNGHFYPEWPESGNFKMQFEWEPIVFGLNDGKNTVEAQLTPQDYGADASLATYTVDGTYTFADSGETRSARLYLRDGALRQVFGYTNDARTGSPWEITPAVGDTFTVDQKWLDLDQNGNVIKNATQAGGTLTFGNDPIVWRELDAAQGQYVVGFIVEDLDGKQYPVYTPVTVQ